MIKTVKIELKKAIISKLFLLAVLIGCAITVFNVLEFVGLYVNGRLYENSPDSTSTPFARWIATEGYSFSSSLYFFIFPLLINIPFAWSYCAEKKSGYEKQVIVRSGRLNYYISKYIALFVSAGLVMTIPLVFNFALLSCYLPFITPFPYEDIYIGVFATNLFSYEFYTNPFLYVFLVLIKNFLLSGLIAGISLSISLFVKYRVVVVIAPFLLLLVFSYFQGFIYILFPELTETINLLSIMSTSRASLSIWTLSTIAIILFVITFGILIAKRRKNDVY